MKQLINHPIKSSIIPLMLFIFTLTAYGRQKETQHEGLSDAEIAHIVVTANTIDVNAGNLAKNKTKNSEVKQFAQQMITDHNSVNKQASDLVKKLGVTPTSNPTSESLKTGGDESLASLKNLKGKAFDQKYIDHEVEYHQAVLDTIDQTLLPNAKNHELKALVTKVRPAIQAHLDHAKKVQSDLATGAPTT